MRLAQTCGSVRKSMSMGLECWREWRSERGVSPELIA
jgi:hypothetical protein